MANEDRIPRAESAAPASISANATIIVEGQVVREGTNGWTCMPDTLPGDNSPICADAVWMEMFQAIGTMAEYEPDRIGIAYMLQGDRGAGVSNSDPFHNDHGSADDYVETGPHLMIIVPKEVLKGTPEEPGDGGPWVMWGDTDYAHIMVPVED